MPLECRLDDAALHASAAAVNQSYLAQAGLLGGADVFVDDRRDVSSGEGMQVECVLDRNAMRRSSTFYLLPSTF